MAHNFFDAIVKAGLLETQQEASMPVRTQP